MLAGRAMAVKGSFHFWQNVPSTGDMTQNLHLLNFSPLGAVTSTKQFKSVV